MEEVNSSCNRIFLKIIHSFECLETTGSTSSMSMSQRTFPPSFWNSNYQPPKSHVNLGVNVGAGVNCVGLSNAGAGGSGGGINTNNGGGVVNYGASSSHVAHAAGVHSATAASHHAADIFSQAEAYHHAHAAALHANHHAHHAAAHHAHLTHGVQSDPWHYSLSSQVNSYFFLFPKKMCLF